MAANKEAIAIVLDVGPSMASKAPGTTSNFETSLECIAMILRRKIFAESKDEVSLILFGTDETANELADGEQYQNITVAKKLCPVDFPLLEYVQQSIEPGNESVDLIDGLVVAMDVLNEGMKNKKFTEKRIFLFSNYDTEFSNDQIDIIINGMKNSGMELNVIGPNMEEEDDQENGARNDHHKPINERQKAAHVILNGIVEQTNGVIYSFEEVIPVLSFFQTRSVRPTPWKICLDIGSLKIPLCGYVKTKAFSLPSWKSHYARDPNSFLKKEVTLHLPDVNETVVQSEETVDGYRYGKDCIPFSMEDKANMAYEGGNKCLSVLGFSKEEYVKRQNYMGDSVRFFVAEPGDDSACIALSAFINALYETNCVCIVRYGYTAKSQPKLGFLAPYLTTKYECLVFAELPFNEDLRQFTFAPLNKIKVSDEKLDAVDELINSMQLDKDEETLKPKTLLNPYIQRLYQCLEHRAFSPNTPLPDVSPTITNYMIPQITAQPALCNIENLFKLTPVEKKEAATASSVFKKRTGTDLDEPDAKKTRTNDGTLNLADLAATVTSVGSVTPVNDFNSLIANETVPFSTACGQLKNIIVRLSSLDTAQHAKALDCVKALRQQTIKQNYGIFNKFLEELKDSCKQGKLKAFWQEITDKKISLITIDECQDSHVTEQDAEEFLKDKAPAPVAAKAVVSDDDEDLFDLMD